MILTIYHPPSEKWRDNDYDKILVCLDPLEEIISRMRPH